MDNIRKLKELLYGQRTGDDVENIIYCTKDYSKFKKLEGNRLTSDKGMQDIELSMNVVGQIANPIIVNEKYEICEGQHRFNIWVIQEKPIYYCVIPGLRLEHCIAMNTCGGRWTNDDRIHAYAADTEYHIPDFERLLDLFTKYPDIPRKAIGVITHYKMGYSQREICSGSLVFTEEQYRKSIPLLDKLKQVVEWYSDLTQETRNRGCGSISVLLMVMAYILVEAPEYFDRAFKQVQLCYTERKFGQWAKVNACFEAVNAMYNYNLSAKNKIDLIEIHKRKSIELKSDVNLTKHEQRHHTGIIGKTGKPIVNVYDRPKLKQAYDKVIK